MEIKQEPQYIRELIIGNKKLLIPINIYLTEQSPYEEEYSYPHNYKTLKNTCTTPRKFINYLNNETPASYLNYAGCSLGKYNTITNVNGKSKHFEKFKRRSLTDILGVYFTIFPERFSKKEVLKFIKAFYKINLKSKRLLGHYCTTPHKVVFTCSASPTLSLSVIKHNLSCVRKVGLENINNALVMRNFMHIDELPSWCNVPYTKKGLDGLSSKDIEELIDLSLKVKC